MFSYDFKSVINVNNHFDLVMAISLALWNATFSFIINDRAIPENRVNTMKCIFLKLKYDIVFIRYIHYLHLEAFEFYNMPTIACSNVLAGDSCMFIKRAYFINRLLILC